MFRNSNYIKRRRHLANDDENAKWNMQFYEEVNKNLGNPFTGWHSRSCFDDYRYYSITKENTYMITAIIGAFSDRISTLEKEIKILKGETEVKKVSKHNLINQEETDDEFIFTYRKEKK